MSKVLAIQSNLVTEQQRAAEAFLKNLGKSEPRPVIAVRAFVSEFPLLARAEVVAICTKYGINRHTANTQYQAVRSGRVSA